MKNRDAFVSEKQPGFDPPLKARVESRLRAVLGDPIFFLTHGAKVSPAAGAAALRRLAAYGIVKVADGQQPEVLPVLPGNQPWSERLSRYQKAMLARCAGEVLAAAIPGVRYEFRTNLTDFRLSTPKTWRDVFHHAADGTPTGWTRYDGTAATEFNARGQTIESRDALGRCLTARSVIYERKRAAGFDPRSGPDRTPLTFSAGFHRFEYQYETARDFTGKMIESPASK